MKKLVTLSISIFVVLILSTAYMPTPKDETVKKSNVEALLAKEDVGMACWSGCQGTREFYICVMCYKCEVYFWNKGIGTNGQCEPDPIPN
jgi:hypothetical protein